jgi:hypothetical protein
VAIAFGSSPGHEALGEPGMAAKIAALKRLAAGGPVEEPVDLRERAVETSDTTVPLIDDGAEERPEEPLTPQ